MRRKRPRSNFIRRHSKRNSRLQFIHRDDEKYDKHSII